MHRRLEDLSTADLTTLDWSACTSASLLTLDAAEFEALRVLHRSNAAPSAAQRARYETIVAFGYDALDVEPSAAFIADRRAYDVRDGLSTQRFDVADAAMAAFACARGVLAR